MYSCMHNFSSCTGYIQINLNFVSKLGQNKKKRKKLLFLVTYQNHIKFHTELIYAVRLLIYATIQIKSMKTISEKIGNIFLQVTDQNHIKFHVKSFYAVSF